MTENPFSAVSTSGRPAIIAHRGVSAHHRENTVAAFEAATRAVGGRPVADGVELDVRRTADGALVVVHDPHLDGRLVADRRRSELPSWVPSLAEALEACGELVVNVEVKHLPNEPDHDPSLAPARETARALAGRPDAGRMLVSTFDRDALAEVRRRAPRLATAALVLRLPEGVEPAALAADGHVALHPHERSITAELVARCHAAGLAVHAWTVDDPTRLVELAALGVDGIVTNDPAAARRVLGG